MSLEDYDIGLRIGQGGFSTVYRARHRESNQDVAIKVIEKNVNMDHEDPANGLNRPSISGKQQQLRQRIDNEISLHKCLKHTHIVELLEWFEDDDYVYIVQEYCPDGNLYRLLKAWGRLSEAASLEIIRQVLCAVHHIHTQGIIHRDLKLSNILIHHLDKSINLSTASTFFTEQIVVKVCDFGFAVAHTHPDDEHHTLCGTPNYIAPEVLQQPHTSQNPLHPQSHSSKSDVWSVGILLHTLVMGEAPFEQPTLPLTLQHIRTTPYSPPREGVSRGWCVCA
ncbi:serine/threonine-protein kinase, partial [archaeon]